MNAVALSACGRTSIGFARQRFDPATFQTLGKRESADPCSHNDDPG